MPWDGVYAVVAAGRSFNMLFNTASVLRAAPTRRPGGSLMLYGASRSRARSATSTMPLSSVGSSVISMLFTRALVDVAEAVVHRWPRGIPHTYPGRAAHQAALEAPLRRIVLAGDYLGDRAGMDTAADSAVEAALAARRLVEAS